MPTTASFLRIVAVPLTAALFLACGTEAGPTSRSACSNRVKDVGETDVDCGGLLCSPCAAGKACASYLDCESQTCTAGVCAGTSAAGSCGDGVVGVGETCDPASSCPTSCDDSNACTTDVLSGSAAACTAKCVNTPITACATGDGCCPAGCSTSLDGDCAAASCGNGTTEGTETCDPPASCPTDCDDSNACTTDVLTGSASACTAKCTSTPVTGCKAGDGCCPSGCTSANDGDCSASCGNGVKEGTETCDPPASCPTSCDDSNACTTDVLTGSAANCTAKCTSTAITQCKAGDGCCPTGCTSVNDGDCSASCGNGTKEGTETCDPPASCPTSCSDSNACTADALIGNAASCSAKCVSTVITACQAGDGCCPTGCTALSDGDCQPSCGNGVKEGNEVCDPPSSCPASCNDSDACTVDSMLGSASACTAACDHTALTQCQGGDGCCPTGCTSLSDSDCQATCGNGVKEGSESCDPIASCPASCNDGNPCTTDTLTGSAATCTAKCTSTNVANGLACSTGKVCSAGVCTSGCWIGGAFYGASAVNPSNDCQGCAPSNSTTAWSNLADGTPCGPATGKQCSSGTCRVPPTTAIDVTAESKTLVQQLKLKDPNIPHQSFAVDHAHSKMYFLQVSGSGTAGGTVSLDWTEHQQLGNLTLSRITLPVAAASTATDHKYLKGFGHGVAMGVAPSGASAEIWMEGDSAVIANGEGRGTRIVWFNYDSITSPFSSSSIPNTQRYDPAADGYPGNAEYSCSIDNTHSRIAVRYRDSNDRRHYALYDLATFKAHPVSSGTRPTPIANVVLTSECSAHPPFQGMTTYGSHLYVMCGKTTNPPATSDLQLLRYDWNTGAQGTPGISNAWDSKYDREPEGLGVYQYLGIPRLCFGLSVHETSTSVTRYAYVSCKPLW